MKHALSYLLILIIGVASASAQDKVKTRETDRVTRELSGPVRSCKIVTEVLEAADKKNTSGGWVPAELTFDKFGNIESEIDFSEDGNVSWKMMTEVDKAGNKVREVHRSGSDELQFINVFEYDRHGNVIEFRRYEADGRMGNRILSEFDKQGRNTSIDSYDVDGMVAGRSELSYDRDGIQTTETRMPDGRIDRFESSVRMENGSAIEETRLSNRDRTLNTRFLEATDKSGDKVFETFNDDNGKLLERETSEYPQRDDHGNWTIEIWSRWQMTDGKFILALKKRITRTISYF